MDDLVLALVGALQLELGDREIEYWLGDALGRNLDDETSTVNEEAGEIEFSPPSQ